MGINLAGVIVDKKIVELRYMTDMEMDAEAWDPNFRRPKVLVLDDGTVIYPSQDDEGNGPGVLFGRTVSGTSIA